MRDHDRLYLNEDRYETPTELTKWVWSLIVDQAAAWGDVMDREVGEFSILDVGCASGEFLYHCGKRGPADIGKSVELVGMDVAAELLAKASIAVPRGEFLQGSILDERHIRPLYRNWDALVMKGVHGIFDQPVLAFENLLRIATQRNAKPHWHVLIVGPFNPVPVDVMVRYGSMWEPASMQPGWNLVSMKSTEEFLQGLDESLRPQWTWERWNPPIDIPEHPDDPLRTYTLELSSHERIVVNGLQLIVPMYALSITR